MIVLGLTGSIGMGKSTAAAMLRNLRVPVHDSDACVHDLLSVDNPAHFHVAAAFPYYEYPQIYDRKTKGINRKALGAVVFADDAKRARLEAVLHPMVRQSQMDFIRACTAKGVDIVCLDIPLLFETGAEHRVDYTIVVSAPAFLQAQRVLARPGMDEARFAAILARQMPDAEKRRRADYVVNTGLGRARTMKELKQVLRNLREIENPAPVIDEKKKEEERYI